LHELALLFTNYILRKAGHDTLYLGQATPLGSVVKVNSSWNADIIITSLMSGYPGIEPLDFVSQLSNAFPQQKVLIAGMLADSSLNIKHRNVFQVKSAEDLKKYL
jgi:hypothetical protein